MEELTAHKAAEIFPLMTEEDLKSLAADIKMNGLLEPICLYEGRILDGRNRYQACRWAGVEPQFTECALNGIGPVEYVVSKNLHRRHLTMTQRAALAVEILPYLQEQARLRQKLVGPTKAMLEPSPELGEPGPATGNAAELMGVSRSTVERTARIAKKDPEVIERMKRGEIKTLNAARRAAGLPLDPLNTAISDDLPKFYYGKGDYWREASQPIIRYLRGWEKRGYEFRNVNPREARKRLRQIESMIEGLQSAAQDLENRAVKATTRAPAEQQRKGR